MTLIGRLIVGSTNRTEDFHGLLDLVFLFVIMEVTIGTSSGILIILFWENVSQELIPVAIAGSIGNPRAYTIRYDFNRKYQLAVKQFIYTE